LLAASATFDPTTRFGSRLGAVHDAAAEPSEETPMTSRKLNLSLATAAFLITTLGALAARAQEGAPLPPGVKGEMLQWIQDAENKLLALAEATPESKFSWRPGRDVRSTAEVFMHVATANYGLPGFLGVKPPPDFKFQTYEKSLTKKADIQKALKDSFAHMKKAFTEASEADMNKPVEFFGMKSTFRGGYMLLLSHAQEHMGQSVAYARMNKITPPWTKAINDKIKAAAQKEGKTAAQ
jgi:uncharacterized damage-inducible protein DinB